MTNNVLGWKFNSNCLVFYSIESCSKLLSNDKLSCLDIKYCFVYLVDRSGCKQYDASSTLNSDFCFVQSWIADRLTYTDSTKIVCASCNSGTTFTITGKRCVSVISDCNTYSDSTGKCTACKNSKFPTFTGVLCAAAIINYNDYSDSTS